MQPLFASAKVAVFGGLLFHPLVSAQDITTSLNSNGSPEAQPPIVLHGAIFDNVTLPASGPSFTTLDPGASNPDNLITLVDTEPLNLGSFNIVINALPGLAANAPALAAFNAAAALWEQYISDPITVTIDANLGTLGAGIIGSANSVMLSTGFDYIRSLMVNDAANEAGDSIVASLPTASAFNAYLPPNASLSGNLMASKANLKALGWPDDLDSLFGVKDATIIFSSTFTFDYNNSDGVGNGLIDFKTVAAHEIGHALGFISAVDQVTGTTTSITPTPLDLFRFRNEVTGSDPATTSNFTTYKRDLVPGSASYEAIFDDLGIEYKMATGLTNSIFPGTDGYQASHWKESLANLIGIMDPALAYGQISLPGRADFRALDVIGYEINYTPVPELSTLSSGVLLLLGLVRRRRAPCAL